MPTSPLRSYEYWITREFSGATPVWDNARVVMVPVDSTGFTFPALGETDYAVRRRAVDVYGQVSGWSSVTTHTTGAGPDSVSVLNTGATVTIDDTGLHVMDGYISIEDDFGSEVLTGSGFGATWADFIHLGLYNASFEQSTTGTMTPGTSVSDPASIQSKLPHWLLYSTGTPPPMSVQSSAYFGRSLNWDFGNASGSVRSAKITSDLVPVSAGDLYYADFAVEKQEEAGDTIDWSLTIQFYQQDGTLIIGGSITKTAGFASGYSDTGRLGFGRGEGMVAPTTARYARVTFSAQRTAGSGTSSYVTLRWVALRAAIHGGGLDETEDYEVDALTAGSVDVTGLLTAADVTATGDVTATDDVFVGDDLWVADDARVAGDLRLGTAGDSRMYRPFAGGTVIDADGSANDTALLIIGAAGQASYLDMYVAGDTFRRLRLVGSATPMLEFGGGSAARDVRLHRPATKTLTVDANTGLLDLVDIDTKAMDTGTALWRSGSSAFPASPSTGDRYFRTDLAMEFYYDGTRWLTTQLFHKELTSYTSVVLPISATSTVGRIGAPALHGGSDIWVTKSKVDFIIAGGGSALSGSHKWVGSMSSDGLVGATYTINSGSSAVWRTIETTIDALDTGAKHWSTVWTKTGTPGTWQGHETIYYRIVAT